MLMSQALSALSCKLIKLDVRPCLLVLTPKFKLSTRTLCRTPSLQRQSRTLLHLPVQMPQPTAKVHVSPNALNNTWPSLRTSFKNEHPVLVRKYCLLRPTFAVAACR